jgi:hypothetical protein
MLSAGGVDGFAVLHRGGHRFFEQDMLAGASGSFYKVAVYVRRCGDVDGVDVRVIDQSLRIGIRFIHTVSFGVAINPGFIATHNGHEPRITGRIQWGAAFVFGYITGADNTPADFFNR